MVLPAGAGDVQIQETRRAFYAGAHIMICLLLHFADDQYGEDTAAAMVEFAHHECEDFAEAVKRGEA